MTEIKFQSLVFPFLLMSFWTQQCWEEQTAIPSWNYPKRSIFWTVESGKHSATKKSLLQALAWLHLGEKISPHLGGLSQSWGSVIPGQETSRMVNSSPVCWDLPSGFWFAVWAPTSSSGHSLDRRSLPTGCGLGLAGLYGTTTLEHDTW